jgi:homoserine kinase
MFIMKHCESPTFDENQSLAPRRECGPEQESVVVRVPASSANLGPGFDAIGLALDMWSEFAVERSNHFEVMCESETPPDMPLDDRNLVCVGVAMAFEHVGKPLPVLKYYLVNRIPYARGLGSSSAAIVGGLLAGLVLAGCIRYDTDELLNMAASIEGHGDNVAAAIYGGIRLVIRTEECWMSQPVNLPQDLLCVCFVPETTGKTATARAALTETVSRSDAVFNIGRVAWLINTLWTNNINQLCYGVQDALHQSQRGAAVYPHLGPVLQAAITAGACAAYLSGAGPAVMAWVHVTNEGGGGDQERVDTQVAQAMLAAAAGCNVKGDVISAVPARSGAWVVSTKAPICPQDPKAPLPTQCSVET